VAARRWRLVGGGEPGLVLAFEFGVDVEAPPAFPLNAGRSVLTAGASPGGHPRRRLRRHPRRGSSCGGRGLTGGLGQCREQRRAVRLADIGVPGWRSQHDRPVGPLRLAPPVRLGPL